ncbi:serine/threonine protein kinase [Nocardiopsis gilva YIM 90087]|uniref:Serine/threonine protein kinase n=1 Tax=Nocardiopsis gilva YIM 90087 TaxID=1235441 RepID=A0A223SAI1_9ACTN|nr:serine/threonine protein kinase [Nocardiopsis gilva YIM 90087]
MGAYRVVGRLGAGGMGAVYAAVDDKDAPLALKVVHREFAADAEFRARFAREVDLMRRVSGTCIPAFVDADTRSQRPWLGIEYVPGATLNGQVRDSGPLAGDMLYGLAAGLAEALQAIHAAGIVHRDLKPGNIILSPSGPKVLDFGIARAIEESAITRTGGLFGTPGWLAPEQYGGASPDASSDMFAWGGLVAFAATGRRPFGSGTADELAIRTMEHAPDLEGVPDELRPVVAAALSKNPADRPTAAQALEAVTAAWVGSASGDPEEATRVLPGLLHERWTQIDVPSADTTTWTSLAPPRRSRWRSHRVLVPAAAVLSLVLIGTGGAVAWNAIGTGAAPTPGADAGGSGGPANGGNGGTNSAGGGAGSGGKNGADGAVDAASLERGGPNLIGGNPGEDLGIGAVRFNPVASDTLELATKQAMSNGEGTVGDWEPKLRLIFESAVREGEDVVFSGNAEYLRDEGSYTLHTKDFMAMKYRLTEEDVKNLFNPDWEGFYFSTESRVLATLDAENPTSDFTFTINKVPPEEDNGDLPFQRYIRYIPPEELWGYRLNEQERSAYGLCYQEGPQWHDMPPLPQFGLPCG